MGDMKEKEKELFECVNAGKKDDVKRLLADGVSANCKDDTGMAPLQHAAYKCDLELCELLVRHGANVNDNSHVHGYTPLMFAALGGNKQVVRFLLENGASTSVQNSVHRTASQMAGFIGNHEIVTLINNFFSKEMIEYYCVPRGVEKEPKLRRELATPLYRFTMVVNLNPVRLSMFLRQSPELLENADSIVRVLDLLCEKMMKQRETDEVMALRFHYLAFLVRQVAKSKKDKGDNLEYWLKYLMKGRESDGFPDNQERLLRDMLKSFPYIECQLLQQIVTNIASKKIAENQRSTAMSILASCMNGQRFSSDDDRQCITCQDFHAKTCNICKSVFYCNKECQKLHWPVHKKFCKDLAVEYEAREEQKKKQKEEEEREKASKEKEDEEREKASKEKEDEEREKASKELTLNDDKEVSAEETDVKNGSTENEVDFQAGDPHDIKSSDDVVDKINELEISETNVSTN